MTLASAEGPDEPLDLQLFHPHLQSHVPKALPALEFKAMKGANGAAGLLRMFGAPLPVIPKELIGMADDFVGGLPGKNGYACVDAAVGLAVDGDEDSVTSLGRHQQHQFENFLGEHDPDQLWKDQLIRVAPKLAAGQVLWVSQDSAEALEVIESQDDDQSLAEAEVSAVEEFLRLNKLAKYYGAMKAAGAEEVEDLKGLEESDCAEVTSTTVHAATPTTT